MDLLRERGAKFDYYDPYIPEIPSTREHAELSGMRSIEWTPEKLETYDVALICTDHDDVDHEALVRSCPLVVDTRNAIRNVDCARERIVKA
jgi:UDP-N-acetyl-D-glucosamine dehydrogenase